MCVWRCCPDAGLPAAQAVFRGTANKALSNGHASSVGEFDNISMNGSEVFKFAVRAVPSVRPGLHLGARLLC